MKLFGFGKKKAGNDQSSGNDGSEDQAQKEDVVMGDQNGAGRDCVVGDQRNGAGRDCVCQWRGGWASRGRPTCSHGDGGWGDV